VDRAEAVDRLASSPVAHLATSRPDGTPHVVPVTFAISGSTVVSAVDHKPKTTRRLQRLSNIEQDPIVSLIADHYEADWSMLWWVRVDGKARVVKTHSNALRELAAKYPQYSVRPPKGPFIVIEMDCINWWAASTP